MLRGYRIASKPEDFPQLFLFRKVLSAAKLLGWIVVCFPQSAGRFWFAKVHKFFGTPCRSTVSQKKSHFWELKTLGTSYSETTYLLDLKLGQTGLTV